MSDIEELDLSEKKLSRIEKELVSGYSSLTSLNLSGNQINKIDNLDKNVTLETLDLSRNSLVFIQGLGSLRRLTTLNLSENSLQSAHGLDQLINLTKLDLSHNALPAGPDVRNSYKLQHLDLSCNTITTIPKLSSNNQLVFLDLSENVISSLENITDLPSSLDTLHLSKNQIQSIFDIFYLQHLHNITHLNLNDNFFQTTYAQHKVNYRPIMSILLPKLHSLDHRLFSDNELDVKKNLAQDSATVLSMLQERSDGLLKYVASKSVIQKVAPIPALTLLPTRSQSLVSPKPVPIIQQPIIPKLPTQQIQQQQIQQQYYQPPPHSHIPPQIVQHPTQHIHQPSYANDPHYGQQYHQMPYLSHEPSVQGYTPHTMYPPQPQPWQQHNYNPNINVTPRMPVYTPQSLTPEMHAPVKSHTTEHDDSIVTKQRYKKLKKKLQALAEQYEILATYCNREISQKHEKEKQREAMQVLFPPNDHRLHESAIVLQRKWREYKARRTIPNFSKLEFEHSILKYRLMLEVEQRYALTEMLRKLWEQTCIIFKNGWNQTQEEPCEDT